MYVHVFHVFRWKSQATSLRDVRQFEYTTFMLTDSVKSSKKPRTHPERYKEAVRVTHLIASELADISDESEFQLMLQFVLGQWRNARQAKRVGAINIPTAFYTPSCAATAAVAQAPSVSDDLEKKRPVPVSTETTLNNAHIAKVKKELAARHESDDHGDDDGDQGDDGKEDVGEMESAENKHGVKIKLNPKARKVGRPEKKRQKTAVDERVDRVWFTAH
jgi:hypothetical protein